MTTKTIISEDRASDQKGTTDSVKSLKEKVSYLERTLASLQDTLAEMEGAEPNRERNQAVERKMQELRINNSGNVVEGVFDGQNMIGPDDKRYPIPANYASKSKLVEGDVLKLSIMDDGAFMYKQIGPVDRKHILGVLAKNERGEFLVETPDNAYKVLLASVTYFKAELGDQVTLIVPRNHDAEWGAIENIMSAN